MALQTSSGQLHVQQPTVSKQNLCESTTSFYICFISLLVYFSSQIGQSIVPAVNDGTNSNLAGVVNIQSAGVVNLSVNQVPHLTGQTVQIRPATSIQPAMQSTLQPSLQHTLQPALQQTLQPVLQQTLQPALQQTLLPAVQSSSGPLHGTLFQTSQGNKILIQHPVGQPLANLQSLRMPATTNTPLEPVINVRQPQPQYIVQKGAGGQNIILRTIPVQGQAAMQSPHQVYVTQTSQISKPQSLQSVNIQQIIKQQLPNNTSQQFSIQPTIQPTVQPTGTVTSTTTPQQQILVQGPNGLIQVPIQSGQIQMPPQTKLLAAPTSLQSTLQPGQPINMAQLAVSQACVTPQDISQMYIPQTGDPPGSTTHVLNAVGDNYIQINDSSDGTYTSHVMSTPTHSRAVTPVRTPSRTPTPVRTPTPSNTPTPVQLMATTLGQTIPPQHGGQIFTQSSNQLLNSGQVNAQGQVLASMQATPTNTYISSAPSSYTSSQLITGAVNILPATQPLGFTAQGAATVGNTVTAPPNVDIQNLPQQNIPVVPSVTTIARPSPAVPANKPQTIQLSAGNQNTLQKIQQQIKNLLLIPNRSSTQQKTLQSLAEVQQKILMQGRVQALQSQLSLNTKSSVAQPPVVRPIGVTVGCTGALNQGMLNQTAPINETLSNVVTQPGEL